ncbi:MAG: hypothetical protein ACMUIP_08015 [bacterium]
MKEAKWIVIILIVLMLIVVYKAVKSFEEEGHEFMADPERCTECHREKPDSDDDYRDVSFGDDISNLCHACHTEEQLGRSHPINVQPPENMNVPEDLHLDRYMNITCSTCHDPHGKRYSAFSTGIVRSNFLRRTNIKNALCIACHSDI